MAEAGKTCSKENNICDETVSERENLRRVRNILYHTIQNVKREIWHKFFVREEETYKKNLLKVQPDIKNHC